MSKLQILIPQYNEDENIIKPLLDSIAIQQDIDFNDIEVFIGNDGSDTKLSVDFLKQYKYRIQYHFFEHDRLAATRKKLFELATAPYVMWCDADDEFISLIALSTIIQAIKQDFDMFIPTFIEQNQYIESGELVYVPHENDCVWVHGKVYKTEFLKENKIEWHPELHEHQDSPFNILARTCAKKTIICTNPLYMWCNNKNSISRKNGIYHTTNTWPHMIDSYQALVDDLKDRGFGTESQYYAKYCLYATYYELSHDIWDQEDVTERKDITLKRLVEFYHKNELLIKKCSKELTEKMNKVNQEIAKKKNPFLHEMPPFEEWFNSILALE